jgi:thioredoxin
MKGEEGKATENESEKDSLLLPLFLSLLSPPPLPLLPPLPPGLHEDSGLALRGLYIISPDGVLHHSTVNNFPVGRSVDEALRTLKALKFVAEHGEVCPAGWQPGDPTMKAGIESSKEYFGTLADSPESPLAPTLQSVESRAELDELVSKNGSVVLDCLANWCGKCHQLAPFVEELQAKHREKVAFAKLDTEKFKSLSEELGVSVLPTFKIFKNGKEVSTVVGYKKKLLADAVEKVA